jgi:hypothetical protein
LGLNVESIWDPRRTCVDCRYRIDIS